MELYRLVDVACRYCGPTAPFPCLARHLKALGAVRQRRSARAGRRAAHAWRQGRIRGPQQRKAATTCTMSVRHQKGRLVRRCNLFTVLARTIGTAWSSSSTSSSSSLSSLSSSTTDDLTTLTKPTAETTAPAEILANRGRRQIWTGMRTPTSWHARCERFHAHEEVIRVGLPSMCSALSLSAAL